MALAAIEYGIAGETGKIQEPAGKAGKLGEISRDVGCSGFILIDSQSCVAKQLSASLLVRTPLCEGRFACKSMQLRAD